MAVLANPCRDRHEAGTGQLRRPWYFAWALGGRSSGRGSAKHGGEDRAEPDVAPDGAGRQGFSELHVLRPVPQVNVCVPPQPVRTRDCPGLGPCSDAVLTCVGGIDRS